MSQTPREAVEAVLDAWMDDDYRAMSDALIDVYTTGNVDAERLEQQFDLVGLEAFSIDEVAESNDVRADAVVSLSRTFAGSNHEHEAELVILRLGEDARPDPNGAWSITNRQALLEDLNRASP